MFVCSGVGIPAPQFVWMRSRGNQNETLSDTLPLIISISESENYQLENNRGSVFRVNSTLVINEALDDDSGSYFCVANSTPGTDRQEFQLVVQGGNYLKKYSLYMILIKISAATIYSCVNVNLIKWLLYFIYYSYCSCSQHHGGSN